jgi:hypothetical protein
MSAEPWLVATSLQAGMLGGGGTTVDTVTAADTYWQEEPTALHAIRMRCQGKC